MLTCFCFCPLTYAPELSMQYSGHCRQGLGVSWTSWIQKAESTSALVKHPEEDVPALDFHPVHFLKKQRTTPRQESELEMVRMTSENTSRAQNWALNCLALRESPEAIKCQDYLSAVRADVEWMYFLSGIYINHFCFFVLTMLWYTEAFWMGRVCSSWGQLIPRDSKRLAWEHICDV